MVIASRHDAMSIIFSSFRGFDYTPRSSENKHFEETLNKEVVQCAPLLMLI
jgi:hypothetical protein